MALFAGLARTDYQDMLRAVGRLIDDQGGRDVRLVEQEPGLIVQWRCGDPGVAQRETYLLTEDDLLALLRDAYALRRGDPPPVAAPRFFTWPRGRRLGIAHGERQRPSYQETLRALGRLLDDERLGAFRLIEQPDAMLLHARRADSLGQGFETRLLSDRVIGELLRAAARRRGSSRTALAYAG